VLILKSGSGVPSQTAPEFHSGLLDPLEDGIERRFADAEAIMVYQYRFGCSRGCLCSAKTFRYGLSPA
jgi:hypothetical protein